MSVTIHETSISGKKYYMADPVYKLKVSLFNISLRILKAIVWIGTDLTSRNEQELNWKIEYKKQKRTYESDESFQKVVYFVLYINYISCNYILQC